MGGEKSLVFVLREPVTLSPGDPMPEVTNGTIVPCEEEFHQLPSGIFFQWEDSGPKRGVGVSVAAGHGQDGHIDTGSKHRETGDTE